MIRSILFILLCLVLCILSPIVWLVMWITHFFDPKARDRIGLFCMKSMCRAGLFVSGTKVTIEGSENIPGKGETVLYAVNHRSLYDVLVTYPLMENPTGYIAKIELEKIPFLSWWMRCTHSLFLNRQNIREGLKTILAGVEKLKSGISMVIFPEGTRNRDYQCRTSLLPFHDASFKLAEKARVSIVPVTLYYADPCLEEHFPIIRASKVIVTYGKPIDPETLSKEDRKFLGKYIQNRMQAMMNAYE